MGFSCAETIETDNKEQFREMLHDELDKWVDQLLPVFDKDRQPTIEQISGLFTETRQKFLGACMQKFIEKKYADLLKQEYASCVLPSAINLVL